MIVLLTYYIVTDQTSDKFLKPGLFVGITDDGNVKLVFNDNNTKEFTSEQIKLASQKTGFIPDEN